MEATGRGEPEHYVPRKAAQRVGLVLGLGLCAGLALMPTFRVFTDYTAQRLVLDSDDSAVIGAARGMQMTLAILSLMVIWWVTEAVPIPVTALLPGLLLPLFHVASLRDGRVAVYDATAAFASYANPVIYLFLAGFLLAGAMRKCGLDRRITLALLSQRWITRSPATILLAMMATTAYLSMWISNTAAAALMLPIALMVLDQLGQRPGQSRFGTSMMLGVAWSASIGGIATIVGSPPNGIVVGILAEQKLARIDFLGWMKLGLPVTVAALVTAWAVLALRSRPQRVETAGIAETMRLARDELGPRSIEQTVTLAAFVVVTALWVTRSFWDSILPAGVAASLRYFDIYEIGLFVALLLFVVPVNTRDWHTVLDWGDARYVDWGTLILFGGGIALSDAMFSTGLADWLVQMLIDAIGQPAPWIGLALVVLAIDFLTEVTSNTATTAMVAPILITLAPELGLSPVTLCVAGAVAASLAFMLPVATPPNALVYGTGFLRIPQMARAGFVMNLLGCTIVVILILLLGRVAFGT